MEELFIHWVKYEEGDEGSAVGPRVLCVCDDDCLNRKSSNEVKKKGQIRIWYEYGKYHIP